MEQVYILKEKVGRIKEASDIFKKIKKFNIDYGQENLIVFFLDVKNKILKADVLFKGGLDTTIIDPIILFRKALLLNSGKIIIAHNHPSGDLTPSQEDIHLTNGLKNAGDILKIDILDSIIFNKKEFYCIV